MPIVNEKADVSPFRPNKKLFYATFGMQSTFAKQYVEIEVRGDGVTDYEGVARQVMFETFANKWAFIYDEREWPPIAREWQYTRLAFIKEDEYGHYRAG